MAVDHGDIPGKGLARGTPTGHEEALALFQQHRKVLWRAVWAITHDHHDTEDVLQETFIRLSQWLHNEPELRYDTGRDGQLVACAFKIARNRARDLGRHDNVRQGHFDDCTRAFDEQRCQRDPAQECEKSEDVQQAMRAVNQLPEQQRVAIVLCVISDLGPKETAAQMGKTAGAVRQLVRRGLRTIQKLVLGGETADATELD